MSALLELAAPRKVVIDDRGRKYTLTVVAPVPKKLWLAYFNGILSESEYSNGAEVRAFDSSTARRELAEQAIVDAEGYTSSAPLHEIENWQTKLPLSHLLALGNVLT